MPQIECPACQAVYDTPENAIPPEGRKVRCAACKALWIATPLSVTDAGRRIEAESLLAPAEMGLAVTAGDRATPLPAAAPADTPAAAQVAEARAETGAKTPAPWHKRMKAARPKEKTPVGWQLKASLCVAAALLLAIGLRKTIVTYLPETAKAYAAIGLPVNLRGLDFQAIRSGLIVEDRTEILLVQGEIRNVSKTRQSLPRLKFSVRDAKGIEIYTWTAQADAKELQPGETLAFRRRLASPPTEGVDVVVRFASRADLVALAPTGKP